MCPCDCFTVTATYRQTTRVLLSMIITIADILRIAGSLIHTHLSYQYTCIVIICTYMHLLRMCVCFLICINLCMIIIHHCTATALTAGYSPNANGLCKQFSWKLYLSTKTILAALQGPLNCNVSFSSGLVALLLWWIEFVIRCYNFGCQTVTAKNLSIFLDV